jgi:DNA mismatch repair protein MutL
VDSGASDIQLFVQDAGKSLIRVTDNGMGMSEADARLAFERHATSKILQIDDLFHIRTMGFRGEALASIAAVSQVELRTRRPEDETGTFLEIGNSRVMRQEPISTAVGTSITMKNLFFSVPARRNFLKSNPAEMRHIVEEFIRVTLAFPSVFFSLTSNGQELMHLGKGSLKQRIIQILGASYASKLVSVQENTDYLNIYGFVGKPETAKKTRGDQYFFVNSRFIRSAYLNHAVMNAFSEMIPADSYPLYVLFIDLDPAQVDVNVHPTKQEIKFEDEKIVYAFVQAAVRHALAQFSITPTLDFDLDPAIQRLDAVSKPASEEKKAAVAASTLYKTFTQKNEAHKIEPSGKSELHHWADTSHATSGGTGLTTPEPSPLTRIQPLENAPLQQLLNTYIVTPTNRSFILIHQQAAHERILYERLTAAAAGQPIPSQKSLFPATLTLSAPDAILLTELLTELQPLGYAIEPFGKDSFIIQGTPADIGQGDERSALETLLEQYKHFTSEIRFSRREKLIRTMARQQAIKVGTILSEREMRKLVDDLFACTQHNITPGGDPTFIEFKKDYVEKLFGR